MRSSIITVLSLFLTAASQVQCAKVGDSCISGHGGCDGRDSLYCGGAPARLVYVRCSQQLLHYQYWHRKQGGTCDGTCVHEGTCTCADGSEECGWKQLMYDSEREAVLRGGGEWATDGTLEPPPCEITSMTCRKAIGWHGTHQFDCVLRKWGDWCWMWRCERVNWMNYLFAYLSPLLLWDFKVGHGEFVCKGCW